MHSEWESYAVVYSTLAQLKSTHVNEVGFQKHLAPDELVLHYNADLYDAQAVLA